MDSISTWRDDFANKDSIFANKAYAKYFDAFQDFITRSDTLGHLLDSLYYRSSFYWFTAREKSSIKDQRLLASYYFLSNRVANLIGSLKAKTVDSLVHAKESDRLRLETQFNVTLGQLNTKLKNSKLLEYKTRDTNQPAAELRKLLHILTEIQKNDDHLPDHLKAFTMLYEKVWNKTFLMCAQNIDSVGVFNDQQRGLIKNYIKVVAGSLDASPDALKKNASYILTFHIASLYSEVRKVVSLVSSDLIPTNVLLDPYRTKEGRDTLSLQQLSYLYRQTIRDLKFTPLVDSLFSFEKSFQKEVDRYQATVTRMEQNVTVLMDEFWAIYFPFLFDIYLLPEKNKVWIDVQFRFSEGPPVNTGISFELTCDWSTDRSLYESLEAAVKSGNPYHVDRTAFISFLKTLGFREEFIELAPEAEHLGSEIHFLYLGEKVSWDIFSPELSDLSNKAQELLTNTMLQIRDVLLEKVKNELRNELGRSIIANHPLLKEHVALNWELLNTSAFQVIASATEVKVRVALDHVSALLDSSYATLVFRKSGMTGGANVTFSPNVYVRVIEHACMGFVVEKEPAGTFALFTPGRQRIGTVKIDDKQYHFTPATSFNLPVPPGWVLQVNDFSLDLVKQQLTFRNAKLTEETPYSRFDVVEVSGTLAFKEKQIAIALTSSSAKVLSDHIIKTLNQWKAIPPGLTIVSAGIFDNKLTIIYKGIEDAIRNGLDSIALEILSKVSTEALQSAQYVEAVERRLRAQTEGIAEALYRLAQDVRSQTIQDFINRFKQQDVLRFSSSVTARVEVQNNTTLRLGVYDQIVTCSDPLLRIEISKSAGVRYTQFNSTCLLGYIKSIIPAAGAIGNVRYDENKQKLIAPFSIDLNGVKGEGAISIGLDGSVTIDDRFFSRQEFLKKISDQLPDAYRDNLVALRDSLSRQYSRIESRIMQRFGGLIYNMEPVMRGDLPVALRLSLRVSELDVIAENIEVSLDGTIDFSHCRIDLEALRAFLNTSLNQDIVSIRNITPLFGRNSFKVKLDLIVQERKYLNVFTAFTSTVDLLAASTTIKIDVDQILLQLGLNELISEAVFRNKNILALDYDDLKFNLYRDRMEFPEGLVKFYGEAVISTSPNIVFPIEITVPVFPGLLDRYQVRMLVDERTVFANIETALTGLLPADWGSFGVFSFHSPRLTYNSKNLPKGISVQIDLKLAFLEGARVSMPQMIINQKGVSFGQLDRIVISIPVNCPIPPFFIFTSGYGQFSKEYISLGGRMTVMPAPEMENIILLDGRFTYRFDNLLALHTKDEIRLFRVLSIGTQEGLYDLKNGIIRRTVDIGGPFKDVFDVRFMAEVNVGQLRISGNGDVKLFGQDVASAAILVDLKNRIITANAHFYLIVKFEGAFSSGKNFISPTFTGSAELKILGFSLAGTELSLQEEWADVSLRVLGIQTGLTVPSYKQITPARIADLILALLTPDLDVEEAFKQILKGNFKINPFSDFGDAGKGGGKGGSKGGGDASGGKKGNGGKGGGLRGNGLPGALDAYRGDGAGAGSGGTGTGGKNVGNTPVDGKQEAVTKGEQVITEPNGFGVIDGTYPSSLNVRKVNNVAWVYDGTSPVAPVAFSNIFLQPGSEKLAAGVQVINVVNSTVYFMANDQCYVFNKEGKTVVKKIEHITSQSAKEKLKDPVLKGNIMSYLDNCLSDASLNAAASTFGEKIVYFSSGTVLTYYNMGRKITIDNSASIPVQAILETALKP